MTNQTEQESGYKIIKYREDSKIKKCVMCNNKAIVIALETNEPLCSMCQTNNDEARKRCK